ncbi:hypothetical protein SF83666_b61190 (plasmid) [Sinorhizobium fredii CCBAU 83666]|nr:hypothetical protein SF83666_b61190 [Sinorhizobium fredii CCBAU 83666]
MERCSNKCCIDPNAPDPTHGAAEAASAQNSNHTSAAIRKPKSVGVQRDQRPVFRSGALSGRDAVGEPLQAKPALRPVDTPTRK